MLLAPDRWIYGLFRRASIDLFMYVNEIVFLAEENYA